jgi:hypothetical protein
MNIKIPRILRFTGFISLYVWLYKAQEHVCAHKTLGGDKSSKRLYNNFGHYESF